MTATLTKAKGPATEHSRQLETAVEMFNGELFENELPPVILTLRNKPGTWGSFHPNKWKGANDVQLDMIQLDSVTAAERTLMELLSTLVHEMANAAVFQLKERESNGGIGGHGPKWRKIMKEIGLPPVQVGPTCTGGDPSH